MARPSSHALASYTLRTVSRRDLSLDGFHTRVAAVVNIPCCGARGNRDMPLFGCIYFSAN